MFEIRKLMKYERERQFSPKVLAIWIRALKIGDKICPCELTCGCVDGLYAHICCNCIRTKLYSKITNLKKLARKLKKLL